MGGKGRRRREKNYRASHDGDARLPPPPKLKELEAIPSKLRRLIKLKSTPDQGAQKPREDAGSEKRGRKAADQEENERGGFSGVQRSNGHWANKNVLQMNLFDGGPRTNGNQGTLKSNLKDVRTYANKVETGNSNGKTTINKNIKEKDETADSSIDGVQKGKRKRQAVSDLRFQDLDQSTSQSRKKKRKEYLEAKRKKNKKQKADDIPEFPGCEEIKFGEIVDAPPKLSFPKVPKKSSADASLERHRLQAIENYRNQRGWSSRPGIKLPSLPEELAL